MNPAMDPMKLVAQILDSMSDLSRLTDRQLLERAVRTLHRLEAYMTQAMEYVTQALNGLDEQMTSLKDRLAAEAQELQDALANQEDPAALQAVADRITATASAVAGLAQPSQVADPETPDQAGPLPETDTTPEAEPNLPATDMPGDLQPPDTAPEGGEPGVNQSY